MDFIRFSISRPVLVSVGVLLLILFGVLALLEIPVQLVPNVDRPVITVKTTWTGRSPQEVEKEIVEEQEDKLKGVSGLAKMTAVASEGQAEIELEFLIGTGMRRAVQEVSDKLREVPEYSPDVDEPVITVADAASESAIAWMVLTCDDPEYDIEQLRDTAEDRIKPLLERVEGISAVNVYGGRDREVHIEIDPRRLAERGITFNQLRGALRLENVNVSAGNLREGYRDVRIRTIGQYEDLDQIRQTIITHDSSGGPVRVADLGEVRLTLAKRRGFVRSRGRAAIALNAIRKSGSNVLKAMEGDGKQKGLKQRIADVNRDVLPFIEPHRNLNLKQVYDETIYIYDALKLVRWNLLIGGALAALCLLLFLRVIRPTLIVSLAIPVSVVGTFVVMIATGRNINVISLAGLAFAVGMVVDNAIVVLENIDRHLGMGKEPRVAAYDAAREVWGAILASTLTTLAVFIPVLLIQGEAGQLFRDIAIAISAAVALSLVIAVTVIPTASARWLRRRAERGGPAGRPHHLFGLTDLLRGRIDAYGDIVHRLSRPDQRMILTRLFIVAGFTLVSLGGAWLLMPPASYLPNGNRNLVFGIMQTPPAYHIEQNQSIAYQVERTLEPYWLAGSVDDLADAPPVIHPFTGQQIRGIPPIENYFFVSFGATNFMGASSKEKENVSPLTVLLMDSMNRVPGARGFAFQPSIFGRGVSGGNAIDVEVTGSDMDQVRAAAGVIYGGLTERFGFGAVRPDPINFNQAGPELRITADRIRASAMGVDVAHLGLAIQALVDGAVVGDYRLEGESIDILLKRPPHYPLTPDTIGMVPVAYSERDGSAGIVPLSALTKISSGEAPQQVRRIEEQRAVTLTVRPPEEVPLELATHDIGKMIASLRRDRRIPAEVSAVSAGTADKLTQVREALAGEWHGLTLESIKSLGLSKIFLALVVTYLLMSALFESFLYPFVIMFTVPLATVGGFIGLAIVHALNPTQQLDVLTMLGFVILIGVVVNNAILVVHQTLNFMRGIGESDGTGSDRRGPMDHREAIRESVRSRVRPIFMTTMTSVFGMLPLVLMPGAGSELYRGLGGVVVGGLIVATLFTLVVVPLLLGLVMDLRAALGGASHGSG